MVGQHPSNVARVPVLALADLVGPLSPSQFIERYWIPGVPAFGRAPALLIEQIREFSVFRSVETLIPRLDEPVMLFGPNQFRSQVPPSVALDFLHNGFNLYIARVERAVPESIALFRDVARELGVAPWQLSIECFAGQPGGVSSRHYDHDINFQILLEGEKLWTLEENRHLQNPLRPYHPRRRPDGAVTGFQEPGHAVEAVLPLEFDPSRTTQFRANRGDVVFLPRGYWHEVHSLSATWSINMVVKGMTWAAALGRALTMRLERIPEFRAYCDRLAYGGVAISQAEAHAREERFAVLVEAAHRALDQVTPVETALSGIVDRYRWSDSADARKFVLRDEVWFLETSGLDEPLELDSELVPTLRRLAQVQETFSWPDALSMAVELDAIALHNLLEDLVDLGVLHRDGQVASGPSSVAPRMAHTHDAPSLARWQQPQRRRSDEDRAEHATLHERFARDGFVVLESVLSSADCALILSEVLESFHSTARSYIHEPRFRIHSPIPLSLAVFRTVREVVRRSGALLSTFLTGGQQLAELSSITVFPGARPQTIHRDERDPTKRIVSVFVNLLETTRDTGALEVFPGTHVSSDADIARSASKTIEVPAGSAVFMNGKLLHRGTGNTSVNGVRPVFYFSFGDTDFAGPTFSIHPDVRGRFDLSDFMVGTLRPDSLVRLSRLARIVCDASNESIVVWGNTTPVELALPSELTWLHELLLGMASGNATPVSLSKRLGRTTSEISEGLKMLASFGLARW